MWISDIHLGTRSCKAEFLLDFLKSMRTEHLYLVGDIVDLWKARSGWNWNRTTNDVVRRVLKIANKGAQVVFVPGNHDEAFRDFLGLRFGDVEIRNTWIHTTADGRRLLVIHGDQFDTVVIKYKWLAILGGRLYETLIGVNNFVNWCRRQLNLPYWSMSAYIKQRTKQATKVIQNFETTLADYAKRQGLDGVVCGHIHKAEIREIDGVLYCNDGDWVESCTALVEHFDGRLEIVEWTNPEKIHQDAVAAAAKRVDTGSPAEQPAPEEAPAR